MSLFLHFQSTSLLTDWESRGQTSPWNLQLCGNQTTNSRFLPFNQSQKASLAKVRISGNKHLCAQKTLEQTTISLRPHVLSLTAPLQTSTGPPRFRTQAPRRVRVPRPPIANTYPVNPLTQPRALGSCSETEICRQHLKLLLGWQPQASRPKAFAMKELGNHPLFALFFINTALH